MRTSDETDKIFAALVAAQAEMPAVNKSATNPHFRSKYAPLDAVVRSSQPILAKNGLAVIQGGKETESLRVVIITRVIHLSGQWIESELEMTPTKNDPQAIGTCLTYGSRYGYRMVGVVTDDDDGNGVSGGKQTPPPSKTARSQNPSKNIACPACGKTDSIIKSKFEDADFVCFDKKGGCGHKWKVGSAPPTKPQEGSRAQTIGCVDKKANVDPVAECTECPKEKGCRPYINWQINNLPEEG